MHLQMILITRK